MFKRKILKIFVLIAFVIVSLSIVWVGISEKKKPDSDTYFMGKIYGSLRDIYRNTYGFSAFDKDGKLLRSEEIYIFLMRYFYIKILNGEEVIHIYVSSHSADDTDLNNWKISEIHPELLVADDVKWQTIKFIQNTYTVERVLP